MARFWSRVLCVGALVASAACSSTAGSTPAQSAGGVGDGSQLMDVLVRNESDACAWVTIYNSTAWTSWSIEDSNGGRPRFVKKGDQFFFRYSLDYAAEEIKIRAEMTNNADCNSGTRADVSNENRDLNGGHGTIYVDSKISGNNGYYSISRP